MKPREAREREEARMRLRQSIEVLKRLQWRLRRTGHALNDPYADAMLKAFWQQLAIDKRIVRGEL